MDCSITAAQYSINTYFFTVSGEGGTVFNEPHLRVRGSEISDMKAEQGYEAISQTMQSPIEEYP